MRLVLATLVLAQAGPARWERAEQVWSERAAAVLDGWVLADGARRAALEEAVEALARPQAGLDRRPDLEELGWLARVLVGESLDEARSDALATFADSLDLVVRPRSFSACSDDPLGASLTVQARSLVPAVALRGEIELGLIWCAPDGDERSARREPFPIAAFTSDVPLYVRGPRGIAGTWRLVPEVIREGERRRGVGVPVEASALSDEALRAEHGADPERERAWRAGERGFAAPVPAGAVAPRGVLVFLTPDGEAPDGFRAGIVGARWEALARELGLELVGCRPTALASFLAARRAERQGQLSVVVARGDAGVALHWLARGQSLDMEGVVLCGGLTEPGAALAGIPVLLVHAPPLETAPVDGILRHVDGARTAFLSEPELPALVRAWLPGLLEARARPPR